MPALPKPHRVAFLEPDIKIEGHDGAYEREAAVLLWVACIETCQRHPRLSVLDADATPLFPQDGHFAPQHAGRGGRATDAFFGPTRRDEVLWLELVIANRPGVVRLHAIGRDGVQEIFDALGPNLGEQIQQVLGAWLTARRLGPLRRRFEPVTSEDVLAVVRVVAPTLAGQARAWSLPVATKPTWNLAIVEDEPDDGTAFSSDDERDDGKSDSDSPGEDDDFDRAFARAIDGAVEAEPAPVKPAARSRRSTARGDSSGERATTVVEDGPALTPSIARPLLHRLPAAFKLPALRVLELALREDLGDAVLAIDPAHPQALFARFDRAAPYGRDFAQLRQVIASAPGWARPYEELLVDDGDPGDRARPGMPTNLESIAAAGLAVLCRPSALHALEAIADRLADEGRVDEALRLLERGVALQSEDPRAHLALLDLHERTDREGAWLEQAMRSASLHGCPMDPVLPWYPDQIHVDLRASTALLNVGRLDEAIALRANRLDGRAASWPHHTRILTSWRKDPHFVAWSYAREGYFRGDEARTVEGFGRAEPGDSVDLALFLDALVALGREDEVPLAWAQFGAGRGHDGAVARLAAARGLMAAGEWRRGIEELWRVELTEPGRDEHVAIARCGQILAAAPIDVMEAALGERVAIGAPTLARRMARDVADFVPAAAKSGVVARALGRGASAGSDKQQPIELDPAWLSGFSPDTRSRKAIDALFAELGPLRRQAPSGFEIADELQRGDRLVNRWLEVAFTEASEDDPAALAQAAAYTAAQALGRYLSATTFPPSTIAGALRTVAGGALALVREHRRALGDREARAVLGALDPLIRRVDRWVGMTWLGTVERSLGLDERSGGDVAGFARDYPTVAARILGPEETAVLSWSVALLHRDREEGWAAKVAAQAGRLAAHTGYTGADEWADAIVAQLAAREIDQDDAIDALHTACYLAEGISAVPCAHAAKILFDAGRAPAALAVLCTGLGAATPALRDQTLASLADAWKRSKLDVPIAFDKVATAILDALQNGDAIRGEKLARWAVAYEPGHQEAHRNLGLALAMQGKVTDALAHLVRGTDEQATQILASVLYQHGKLPEALAVLDYASRWYVRADQWLTYAGIADEAQDRARSALAYQRAQQLDSSVVVPAPPSAPADTEPPSPHARDPIFAMLEAGDHAAAVARLADPSWRVRRTALHASRFRYASENQVAVTPRARAAALAVLGDTVGTMDREALLARALALLIREHAYFARDPMPRLGERMAREVFQQEFRARGGVVVGEAPPPVPGFVDREVVPGAKIARTSEYVALLRALAEHPPAEALAQVGLDEDSYVELATAWAAAMDDDPTIARTIAAGLAACDEG